MNQKQIDYLAGLGFKLPEPSPEDKRRIEIERRIARRVVRDALALGYRVSVCDGEEHVVTKSINRTEIVDAMFSTDEDWLWFYPPMIPRAIGFVRLIYGNGADVIADCTDKPELDKILAGATDLAERLEA